MTDLHWRAGAHSLFVYYNMAVFRWRADMNSLFVYYNSWIDRCALFICILCLFIITKLHLILLPYLVFHDFASCFSTYRNVRVNFLTHCNVKAYFLDLLQCEGVLFWTYCNVRGCFWWSGCPKVVPLFCDFYYFFWKNGFLVCLL